MGYVEAFANFGAVLTNPQWSVSAFGRGGCLVLSLWQDLLKRGQEKQTLRYIDSLSQWEGNFTGRDELRRHLIQAKAAAAPIKLVIAHPATPEDAAMVGRVADERQINKTFSVKDDFVGTIESFDGDSLALVFTRAG